jgi:hypothetical protein
VLGSAVTNASGVATLAPPNLPVATSLITADDYTASFAGAACLSASSVTATLDFQALPLIP